MNAQPIPYRPFTDADTPDLMRLVRWKIRRYADHPEWDDLLAEAYLGALVSVRRAARLPGCKWTTAACTGALWAAKSYLREKSQRRTHNRKGVPFPDTLSWDDLPEDCMDLTDEDPARAVIERVGARQLWAALLDPLSPADRTLMERRIWDGEACDPLAAELAMPRSTMCLRVQKLLKRFRRTVGDWR